MYCRITTVLTVLLFWVSGVASGAMRFADNAGGRASETSTQAEAAAAEGFFARAEVDGLWLFETPSKRRAKEDREYVDRFPPKSTRYVGWELRLTFPEPVTKPVNFQLAFRYLDSDGGVVAESTKDSKVEAGWQRSWHTAQWGNSSGSWWKPGKYLLEVRHRDRLLAEKTFWVSDARFLDRDDGTVLDTNTGLIWLKDASCEELPGMEGREQVDWETAKAAAARLASGTCGLSDGSMAGDWRLPTIEEFCSGWDEDDGRCLAESASDSLIDRSLDDDPYVPNAAGTGLWRKGDAFVGVKSSGGYWSATVTSGNPPVYYISTRRGQVSRWKKDRDDLRVWPVRSGQ